MSHKNEVLFYFIFLTRDYIFVIRNNKNISPWHNILNDAQNKHLVLHEKQFCVKTKSLTLHKKQCGVDKNKLMLHEKVFHINKNKLMLHKKSISCRKKQDDSAPKKYFALEKVIFFPERRAIHYFKSTCKPR